MPKSRVTKCTATISNKKKTNHAFLSTGVEKASPTPSCAAFHRGKKRSQTAVVDVLRGRGPRHPVKFVIALFNNRNTVHTRMHTRMTGKVKACHLVFMYPRVASTRIRQDTRAAKIKPITNGLPVLDKNELPRRSSPFFLQPFFRGISSVSVKGQ